MYVYTWCCRRRVAESNEPQLVHTHKHNKRIYTNKQRRDVSFFLFVCFFLSSTFVLLFIFSLFFFNNKNKKGLHHGQPASAILNCLLAHQLCAEDPSCKSMETVIQHICGPETGTLTHTQHYSTVIFKYFLRLDGPIFLCILWWAKGIRKKTKKQGQQRNIRDFIQ